MLGFSHCHLGFRHLVIFSQIHSKTLSLHSRLWLKLIQSLKLIHSYLTEWWQPSWILPSWIHAHFDSAILHKTLTQTNSIWLKLIHSHSTWWCQPSWILPSWIQTPCYLFWDSLKNTVTPIMTLTQLEFNLINLMMAAILKCAHLGSTPFCTKLWLKLIQSD